MAAENIYTFIKENITFEQYLTTLYPGLTLIPQGDRVFRCRNIISDGDNPTAMMVNDENGFFKCFSHGGESGDIITLHQLLTGNALSPSDTCTDLAHVMGVNIPDELLNSYQKTGPSKSIMYSAMEKVADYAHEFLMTSKTVPPKMIEYVKARGISGRLLEDWGLGVLPDSDRTVQYLKKICTEDEYDALINLGVITEDEFVPLHSRLLFPLVTRFGRTVGFSGRVVDGVPAAAEKSKYINSRTSHIYNKQGYLLGEKNLTKSTRTVMICEGNFDVIALQDMFGSDTCTALAICGTSLTSSHLALLKNVNEVILCLDADDAGQDAMMGYTWLVGSIPTVTVVTISGGKDPWDMYRSKKGRDALKTAVMNRTPYPQHVLARAQKTLSRPEYISYASALTNMIPTLDDRYTVISLVSRHLKMSLQDTMNILQGRKAPKPRATGTDVVVSPTALELANILLACPKHTQNRLYSLIYECGPQGMATIMGATETDMHLIDAAMMGDRGNELYRVLADNYDPISPDTFVSPLLGRTLVNHIVMATAFRTEPLTGPEVMMLARLKRETEITFMDIMALIMIGWNITRPALQ